MQPITHEWVLKAEADYATGMREEKVRENPNYDAVCFQAQQYVEKYLKARMQEAGIPPGRIHDLDALLRALLPIEPGRASLRPSLLRLNAFAVEVRYPGESADEATARESLALCTKARTAVRAGLGLDVNG